MSLSKLIDEIKTEFPDFRIVRKSESRLMKVADIAVRAVTFNRMKDFLTRFTTVVGWTVYVTDEWDFRSEESKIRTLRHERVHMRQCKRLTRPFFFFLYLFVAPLFLAYFRTKFEKEAYAESMRHDAEVAGSAIPLMQRKYREVMISHFTSPSYGWMWVRRGDIENWYDDVVDGILADMQK